jgi:pilus assembly protein CpaE
MPKTNESAPIVAIVEKGDTHKKVANSLDSQTDFQPVVLLETLNGWVKEVNEVAPDIILIDSVLDGHSTLELIDDISLQFPEVAIVAILPNDNPVNAQKAMLAGARAFVVQPFTRTTLLSSLRRVRDLEARRSVSKTIQLSGPVEQTDTMKILSVFSPRGGVGTSTVATNLALSLHNQIESRVLLFEGKQLFGHLGVMLNIRAHNNLTDLIPHAGALDTGLVNDVVTNHASGIDVLLAPSDVQAGQGIRPEDLVNILRGIRRMYDFIVIDAGSHLNENAVTLMDISDKILLVTTPDLAALHDISRFYTISRTLAYPLEKMLTIINRANMMGGVKPKEIETALHQSVFAQIPEDESRVIRSLNRGVPLIYHYPRSPVSRSIQHIAKTLAGMSLGEETGRKSKSSNILPKVRAKFSTS